MYKMVKYVTRVEETILTTMPPKPDIKGLEARNIIRKIRIRNAIFCLILLILNERESLLLVIVMIFEILVELFC